MLRWRFITGLSVIALLIGVCWLDMLLSVKGIPRGVILFPIFLGCLYLLGNEVLDLLVAGGLYPRRVAVHTGTLLLATVCWLACLWQQYKMEVLEETVSKHGWQWASTASFTTLLGMAIAILICFGFEMLRYERPGGVTLNLAGAVFAVTYIGLLGSFVIQLRMAFGIAAILSLIVVAKMGDIGAYTVGRLFGSRKIAPKLSPGKTVEGAIGGIAFACIGSLIWFKLIIPWTEPKLFTGFVPAGSLPACLLFGIFVCVSGALGDLAASLIKRDVGVKDSSKSIPGFGGFLDLFDSLLMAAPVAYACWAFGFFGRDI
jgi:phosphatidate cytidylyltransferase